MKNVVRVCTVLMLIVLFALTSYGAEEDNLVINDDFEEETSNWIFREWEQGGSLGLIDYEEAFSGKNSLMIQNQVDNDARMVQTISVVPNQTYKISAYIKTNNILSDVYGASVSIDGILVGTPHVLGTSDWTYVEMYGKTLKDQETFGLTLALGNYGSLVTGQAWFDSVSVVAVNQVPEGAVVQLLANEVVTSEGPFQGIYLYGLIYFMVIGLAYVTCKRYESKVESSLDSKILIAILLVVAVIKVIISPYLTGYINDNNTFIYWADIASKDFSNFYHNGGFADYPPLYIYVLALIGKVANMLNLAYESSGYLLLIKMPAIIADSVTAYLLYRFSKDYFKEHISILLAIIYLLNPLVIHNSVIWGQVDSVFTCFIVGFVMLLMKKRYKSATLVLALGVLLKPHGLIFIPVLAFTLLREKDIKLIISCLFTTVITLFVVILPFSIGNGYSWIISLYFGTLDGYQFASFNAYNFFALMGGNEVLDSTKFILFSYSIWGYIFILSIVGTLAYLTYKNRDRCYAIEGSVLLIAGTFILSSRMHERYMFAVVALLIMACVKSKDSRLIRILGGFIVTNLINVQAVLYEYLYPEFYQIDGSSFIVRVVSLINCLIFVYLIYVLWTPNDVVQTKKKRSSQVIKTPKLSIVKIDVLIMLVLTGIYLVMALSNLGNNKSPNSFYNIVDEPIIIRFDQAVEISDLSYFTGVEPIGTKKGTYNVFTLNSSGEYDHLGSMAEDSSFTWKTVQINQKTNEVYLMPDVVGGAIGEIGLFDYDGNQIVIEKDQLEMSSLDLGYLIDEQDRVYRHNDYMNSTYFDEIYFVRTAYEMENGMQIYETTHPPLGKMFIQLGMKLFGNNPLGWRIIGVVFGALLIPIMYVFGKHLFGERLYATIAALLITFDFMHFSHVRLGTIDIYVVVFMTLMVYFMYRYVILSNQEIIGKAGQINLMLSGVFMALGASVKWVALYGAFGLAIMYFIRMIKGGNKDVIKQIIQGTVYFVIIPVIIYGLVHMSVVTSGSSAISQIIDYQKNMFNYHSDVTATHPFSSMWYEWMFMVKPLWLYTNSHLPEGTKSTIVSMGNPAIWWMGFVGIIGSFILYIKNRDIRLLVLFIALLSQIIPWLFVSRITFIYHFFGSMPWVILLITYVLKWLKDKYQWGKYVIGIYILTVVFMFVLFYPVISASMTSSDRVESLKWFSSWYF